MYFDFSCLICFELFTNQRIAIKLSCGHLVCSNCIKNPIFSRKCPYRCNIENIIPFNIFDLFETSLRAFERRKIKNFEIYKPVNSLFDHRQDLLNYLMKKINFDLMEKMKELMNERMKNEYMQEIQILKASIEKMIDQSLSRDNDILENVQFDQLTVLTDLIYEVETQNSQNVSALFFFTADNPQLEDYSPICFILWATDIHYVDDINIDMI
jgi:hypothetical protein